MMMMMMMPWIEGDFSVTGYRTTSKYGQYLHGRILFSVTEGKAGNFLGFKRVSSRHKVIDSEFLVLDNAGLWLPS